MDGSSPPPRSGRPPSVLRPRLAVPAPRGRSAAGGPGSAPQTSNLSAGYPPPFRCRHPRSRARRRRSAAARRTDVRHGGHQRPRVRMRRGLEQHLGRALLDDAAGVQHRDLVAQVVDHREVVADQQVGHAELLLQVLQQVQHLRLHRDVERADRLVGDDQARPRDQRARDRDALALAAGELVRIACSASRGAQADRVERLGDARCARRPTPSRPAARRRCGRRAGAGRASRTGPGTPSGSRAAPRAARPATARSGRGRASVTRPAVGRSSAITRRAKRRLAGARFADQAEAGAGLHREAHAAQRLDARRRLEQALARQR